MTLPGVGQILGLTIHGISENWPGAAVNRIILRDGCDEAGIGIGEPPERCEWEPEPNFSLEWHPLSLERDTTAREH